MSGNYVIHNGLLILRYRSRYYSLDIYILESISECLYDYKNVVIVKKPKNKKNIFLCEVKSTEDKIFVFLKNLNVSL